MSENTPVFTMKDEGVIAAAPVETSIETGQPVEQPAVETPVVAQPTEQPVPVTEVPTPVVAPTVEYDPYEALGFEKGDANAKKVLDAYRAGKLKEYIDISARDYNAISDIDLIRQSIDEQYHMLPKEDRDLIFQNKYNLTGEAEADRLANAMIKADAFAMRQQKISEQQNYTIPEYKAPEQQVDTNAQKQVEEFSNMISSDPVITTFESNRVVKLGSGEHAYNFEAPKSFDVKQAILNPAGVFAAIVENVNGSGKLNIERLVKIANYAYHMDDVESALINHGITLGDKKLYNELHNVHTETPGTPADPKPKFRLVD